jgi:hypothetical protein
MAQIITLEISEDIAQRAQEVAARTQPTVEDVLVDWLGQSAADLPVEFLPDDQVLTLAEMQMADDEQAELSELLALKRENALTGQQRERLEALMRIYRHGLRRKAQAIKVAVERKLLQSLS